ncbi:L,D-transpeptidase family protein [Sphingomonas sp. HITSZ_GF]|uniref:L,D-transpeptidase family protein n=1 Tax=Sphingomonas sp. HITSZ_GF TaxID=3037247 RepID=UPI00240D40D2|nr:L,D-transpeptidase family protein [Sphingomonas sp. HITSZ_GF]MDG2532769.1 L,D-transpeptidase family protein [Sphingomonas sp. HITSZ_GF]
MAAGQSGTSAKPPIDWTILHAQVILDHLGFSPGILDGREGQSLTAALKGFQISRGIDQSGALDPATLRALAPYASLRPVRRLTLDAATLKGPYINPMPKDPGEQAKMPSLAYTRPLEKLAEMFHTTPEVLVELNPGGKAIEPGAEFVFPNALPASRDYPADIKPEWRQTLNDLNVEAKVPEADHIVVDKSDKVLRVFDKQERLVAQFSATMGSQHDPLPIGTWKIYGADTNPKFHYNPALFWDAKKGDEKAMLPPGPNGPVGVVWLDLSKEHYGIHGTPEPQLIGRTQSHGCIRLTNWDVARLALMIKPGTKAVFQE